MNRRKFISVTAVAGASLLACGIGKAEDEKPSLQKECPKKDDNQKRCTCTNKTCPRRGICCECVVYHRDKGEKPFCVR